jgi:hypothetical protein
MKKQNSVAMPFMGRARDSVRAASVTAPPQCRQSPERRARSDAPYRFGETVSTNL